MAHLDEVIFKPFADQSAELNALQSEVAIDLAQTIPPLDIATLQDGLRPARSSTAVQSCNRRDLRMNQTPQAVRQPARSATAIAYAVNKQAYIDAFYAGPGQAGRQLDAAGDPVLQEARDLPDLRPAEGEGRDRRRPVSPRTSSSSTSTTRPTSSARTCPIRRAWPRRSRRTSRPSASRSPSRPRTGGPATSADATVGKFPM